jgi:ketosteroid isomerase-like protein
VASLAPSDVLQVLERWRQAAIDQSVEDMSSVYATDAVHEFPFTRRGLPSRMQGRDEIVSFIAAFWANGPLRYERYRTIAIHYSTDPSTIVVEQDVEGTSSTTGPFVLPNLVVLRARHGEIVHLRDYANVLAAAEAIGTHSDTPGHQEM